MDEMDRIMLRGMAWERAKGEMQSILHLYRGGEPGFEKFEKAVSEFVKNVEDNGIGGFT